MRTVEVNITEETASKIEEIMQTRGGRSLEQVLQQLMERGVYQLSYRTERNRTVYAREKELREEFKAFKATRK
jgi:hypothetical protein